MAQMEYKRIGIIGGTFDPVHYAHLAIAEEVYHALKLTSIVFVPAGQPPHKEGSAITPVHDRLAMLKLAIAENAHFALSLVDIQRSGPSYTVDTLRLLHEELGPHAELYFVLGGDSLKDLPTWYDPGGILAQATIVALVRPGYGDMSILSEQLEAHLPGLRQRLIILEGPQMQLSSTDLRRRVAEGRPIKYQTPQAVENYIFRQHLYQSKATASDVQEAVGQRQEEAHAANTV
jgi:nicotinate-nucleotide adenylyltransferase